MRRSGLATRGHHADKQATIQVDGGERTYTYQVPSGYDGTRAMPLVLALHGRLGQGSGEERLSGFVMRSTPPMPKRFGRKARKWSARPFNSPDGSACVHGLDALLRVWREENSQITSLVSMFFEVFPITDAGKYCIPPGQAWPPPFTNLEPPFRPRRRKRVSRRWSCRPPPDRRVLSSAAPGSGPPSRIIHVHLR